MVRFRDHPRENHLARAGGQQAYDLDRHVLADVLAPACHDNHRSIG